MRSSLRISLLVVAIGHAVAPSQEQANPVVVHVYVAHPGAAISPQMFGAFFEDTNFAADGGL